MGSLQFMATYNKDQAQFFNCCPLQCMLIMLVWRVVCGRDIIGDPSSRKRPLFNEDIRNETVDDRWACWRIRPGPQNDTRSGENLKRVEHSENSKMFNVLVGVTTATEDAK
jgi:hypothetical protein